MSNYITQAMLEERMTAAKLAGFSKVTGDALAALLGSVIKRAEAMVDGYLSARFSVPVPANALVEEWALAIAEHELYKRGGGAEVPDKIRQSYDDTIAQLKDAASGKLSIPSATAPSPRSATGASMKVHAAHSLFDEHSMEGF